MPLSKYYKNPFEVETVDDGEMAGPPPAPPLDYNKLYTDSLQRGMESADQNRVTRDDIDANQRQQTLRNVLSGFSQAAANVGGTQTVVPGVAQGFDEADKDALGARDRLASQGMQEQQRAIEGLQNEEFRPLKLEGTKLQVEGARRQNDMQVQAADPKSSLSQNIRTFYKDRVGINFPDNISALDIESYVKDPALTKMAYENQWKLMQANQNFSRQQAEENRMFRMEERERDRQTMIENAKLRNESNLNPNAKAYNALPEPQKIAVKELSTSAAKKQVISNQIEGFLDQWKKSSSNAEKTRVGQQMIKLLNSTEGQDAVGAEEARRLANELEPYTWKSPTGLPRLGQDLKGFENRIEAVRNSLMNAVKTNQAQVMDIYQEFAPETMPQTRTVPQNPTPAGRRIWSPNQQAGR
jgi:hypothetical protein